MHINKIEAAPCIFIYEDAFNTDNFIELIEEETHKEWPYLEWMSSKIGGDDDSVVSEYRTSLEMPTYTMFEEGVSDQIDFIKEKFLKNILEPVDKCVWDYRNYFNVDLKTDTGYSLLKYYPGAEYHLHCDHGSTNSRILSLVGSLGDDCDGGELEFPFFDISIKLKKNSLVLFPSNFPYSHIAHPIEKGVKYSLIGFFI